MTRCTQLMVIAISTLISIAPVYAIADKANDYNGKAIANSSEQSANGDNVSSTADTIHLGVQHYLSKLVAQHTANQKHVSGIELNIAPMHRGLKLQTCDKPLSFDTSGQPRLPGRVSVKVSCHSQAFWSLYVSASVSWYQSVVMAKHSLFKAQTISAEDIYTTDLKVTRANNQYLSSAKQVLGKVVKRQLSADKPIDPRYLQQANLVSKGDAIILIAQSGAIAVRSSGVALGSGMAGQQIKVENSVTKRVVKARIVERGKVQVVM